MNWNIFKLKYDKQEADAFEKLSYFLFCSEFGNKIGIFRYKNQTGTETELLEKNGKFYGFQAKYYTSSVSSNKTDIIDSIEKAKSKNPKITNIFVYINQELSESSKKKKKKPQYQIDIEKAATEKNIVLEWRVPSYFELQLSLPENKHIFDLFFSLEPNYSDLIDEVYKHNNNILNSIQTDIIYNNKQIKFDRNALVAEISTNLKNNKNIVISGEGGCGKTAILKEFYNIYSADLPIAIFKASELNVKHINDLLHFDNSFKFIQFIDTFKDEQEKIFVIDSAEKLAEFSDYNVISELLDKLKENGWYILFTTRYSYLNDLVFHLQNTYKITFEVIDVPLVEAEEIVSVMNSHGLKLAKNKIFQERLRNLFYLSEYVKHYVNINENDSLKDFTNLLWKKRIQDNVYQQNDLHLEREKCFMDVVKMRCNTGQFYIRADELSRDALFYLKQDEILGYDEAVCGYFITHDIYEEWALDKIISIVFAQHSNIEKFFSELGDSLPMRRAFRTWLSEMLHECNFDVENFIQSIFLDNNIVIFWKDEILISILLSDYSVSFFKFYEDEILKENSCILERILFLLRIACIDVATLYNTHLIKPIGKGWEALIELIYLHKDQLFYQNLALVLPILKSWCEFNKSGVTTRYAGLLAIELIKQETFEDRYRISSNNQTIFQIVFNASSELKFELNTIFEEIVKNKLVENTAPYKDFCIKILQEPFYAFEIIKNYPSHIIQLCDLFWQRSPEGEDGVWGERHSMEKMYGVTESYELKYFPASANQTPIKFLLKSSFYQTLDFIIYFTNKSVENYKNSDYGYDVEEIILDVNGVKVTQYLNWSIWSMYRGGGSPVVPDLLESIHMALEEFLLGLLKIADEEIIKYIKNILLMILTKSKSASLTAVVCSIIFSNYNKFSDIALILFKVIELFPMDIRRCVNESQVKFLYSMGFGLNKEKDMLYADERLKTCEDEHRKVRLEGLFLHYQFYGIVGATEEENKIFIDTLYKIIDKFKEDTRLAQEYGILLARMDRRNLEAKVVKEEDGVATIELTPKELSDEHRRQSEQVTTEHKEMFKYHDLYMWSNFLFAEKRNIESPQCEKYDNNPHLALSEVRSLIEELTSFPEDRRLMHYATPTHVCSKLMIYHSNVLPRNDMVFCKEVIFEAFSHLLSDNYSYQINDGVESAVHAIPILLQEFPEDEEEFIFLMVGILLDTRHIGQYKRVCDYLFETIRKYNLWEIKQATLQKLLLIFIKFKPLYDSIVQRKRKEAGFGNIHSKESVLNEFYETIDKINVNIESFDVACIDTLDIYDLEIVYQLIPANTQDTLHLKIFKKALPFLVAQLMCDANSIKDKTWKNGDIYWQRLNIFSRVSHFILMRKTSELDAYIKFIVENLCASDETASFIQQFIFVADRLDCYENFWIVWNKFYPKVKELSSNGFKHHLKSVIINYLLAFSYWNENIDEWHMLKKDNLPFYLRVARELGHIPSVLLAIIKVLNSVGAKFGDDGIIWLHVIISNNINMNLGDDEQNILLYLENFLRKFVFVNKQKIKKDVKLKTKILLILNFMVERGSSYGYMLRESIL